MLYLTYRTGLNNWNRPGDFSSDSTRPLPVSPLQAARYIRAAKRGNEFYLRRGEDYLETSIYRDGDAVVLVTIEKEIAG